MKISRKPDGVDYNCSWCFYKFYIIFFEALIVEPR